MDAPNLFLDVGSLWGEEALDADVPWDIIQGAPCASIADARFVIEHASAYELGDDAVIEAYQWLIDHRSLGKCPPWYGRSAADLILSGACRAAH